MHLLFDSQFHYKQSAVNRIVGNPAAVGRRRRVHRHRLRLGQCLAETAVGLKEHDLAAFILMAVARRIFCNDIVVAHPIGRSVFA